MQGWILKSFSSCVSLSLLEANSCIPGTGFPGGNTSVLSEAQLGCLANRREAMDEVMEHMEVDVQNYRFKFRQKLHPNSIVAS